MKFAELLKTRQSVRQYAETPVEEEKLEQLIEAVRLSPSASNSQPWRLVVVDDPELRAAVARATFSTTVAFNKFSLGAPVIVAFCFEKAGLVTQIGGFLKKRPFYLIDIGIAAAHFCLQAAELGLGTCMLGWFDEKKIKRLLGIPRATRIGLLVTLGYPAAGDRLREKIRKPAGQVSRSNRY